MSTVIKEFGPCSCGQQSIVRVNSVDVCAVCLPDALKAFRKNADELRKAVDEYNRQRAARGDSRR